MNSSEPNNPSPKGTFQQVLSPTTERVASLICLAASGQKVLLTVSLILSHSNSNSFVVLIYSIKIKTFPASNAQSGEMEYTQVLITFHCTIISSSTFMHLLREELLHLSRN